MRRCRMDRDLCPSKLVSTTVLFLYGGLSDFLGTVCIELFFTVPKEGNVVTVPYVLALVA